MISLLMIHIPLVHECVKRGYEVHAVRRTDSQNLDRDRLTWHTLDLFNIEKVEALIQKLRPKYLMHLAWKVETGLNLEDFL